MNSWQRLRDELIRRVLGFSPFELGDDLRRLHKLVDRLRDEQAREIERLRAELRHLGADGDAPRAATAAPSPGNGKGGGKKRLPLV